MIQFLPAPVGVDVVLREQQHQQRAVLNYLDQIVAEDVARLKAVVDEEVLRVDVGCDIQIACERGHPAELGRGALWNLVVRVGVADEDVILLPRPACHSPSLGVVQVTV